MHVIICSVIIGETKYMATIFLVKNRLFLIIRGPDKDKPTPESVVSLLSPLLTYVEKKQTQEQRRGGRELVTKTATKQLFSFDFRNRMVTFFGAYERVKHTLLAMGHKVEFVDLSPEEDPSIFQPRWDLLLSRKIELRPSQERFLLEMLSNRCGRFLCPTGWGKSFSIFALCVLLPKAKILVTSYSQSVIDKTIYTDLLLNGIDVGLITSKRRTREGRVMCVSSGCLHHVPDMFDIMVADEAHELATDSRITQITRFGRARVFALSASHGDRTDGGDNRLAAFFGPIRVNISYNEALQEDAVAPIEVIAREVNLPSDPARGYKGRFRTPLAIWRNDYRNSLIAQDARSYPEDMVLISCTTLEHVLQLKRLIPEAIIVFADKPLKPATVRKFKRANLFYPGWRPMTPDRLTSLFKYMAKGPKRIFIATPVISVGVNLRPLSVLIRADGQASAIKSTQLPGRVSRRFPEKNVGIVHDYVDNFASPERSAWYKRNATYKRHGWKVTVLAETGQASRGFQDEDTENSKAPKHYR